MKASKSPILEALRNASVSEPLAVAFMESQRWGDTPYCPLCASVEVYKMMGRNGHRNPDYRWRCRDCKRMFSVRMGTPLEETRLPVRVWVFALWQAAASKKGISALQLAREMEITHKSALFVLRRIRHGAGEEVAEKLTGTVEADEVYIGGKPRYPNQGKRGRGTDKTPVLGMVQRGGDVRFQMMERITSDRVGQVLAENADRSCRLITDQLHVYTKPGREFEGGHEVVNHSKREYVRPGTDIHSNTIEGVFSLIRRGSTEHFTA